MHIETLKQKYKQAYIKTYRQTYRDARTDTEIYRVKDTQKLSHLDIKSLRQAQIHDKTQTHTTDTRSQ